MKTKSLRHSFVKYIPETLEDGVLYISIDYCTAAHKCVCGCGNKVITPITPTDWELTFNGEAITLSPSIGNWSFDCQSHYWVKNSEIQWAGKWSRYEIDEGRRNDQIKKQIHFSKVDNLADVSAENEKNITRQGHSQGFWRKLFQRFGF
ncbi:DUF6527 family protein [Arsenicibacter rosenii]|uniref:Uncharacterized protein n=1 Tax=Arsenicibacter rosenii TaxID=1750698 RepID=A0A1S2VEJ6_9BACT|nr:DUF6527 family protein [Arsenicibacter rosenii]OIN56328.1 hypothetical protein BLX24_25175 [Arsenicibacter rosenii]